MSEKETVNTVRADPCAKCGNKLPLSAFSKSTTRKDKTHSYCLKCFSSYQRERYAANPEKEKARCAAYNKANPSVPRNAMRRFRAKDPAGSLRKLKAWRSANKEKVAEYHKKKHAIRRGAKAGDRVSAAEWNEKLAWHKWSCVYCGSKENITQDHVIPLCRGGRHVISNIVPACLRCNTSKGKKTADEFVEYRRSVRG